MLTATMHYPLYTLLACLLPRASAGPVNNPMDPGLARYVSRPDLAAPVWDVKIHREDQVAPGYWFVSPYKAQDAEGNGRAWVGPHIYDGKTGELVWSGSQMDYPPKGNVEDFRLSNVRGKTMMTLMSAGTGQAIIMGSDYQVAETLQVDVPGRVNTHELNFVENGTRALVIKSHMQEGTKEMKEKIGYEGRCVGEFDGFEEYDTKTWKPTFDWRSFGKVGFEESSLTGRPVRERCGWWDFIHSNSVDKTPEGDYYWNSRHCDTVYKISGKDGHIIWRLGGKNSDFNHIGEDMIFSRQHDIRHRSQNKTHVIVTILDNARGVDKQAPTWPYSRGMQIALDEKHMTATVERTYDHPDGVGAYAARRGNYQILENGNVFMGWSEQGTQSEHAADGTIIMEARFKTEWLGGYRNYKFPFVGHPIEPPVAHSQAYPAPNNSTVTVVHVSWNGATEVKKWNIYRTVSNGQVNQLVATSEKLGFETVLAYGGLATFVIAEALDANGTVLGRSSVMRTNIQEGVNDEDDWLNSPKAFGLGLLGMIGNTVVAFALGCVVAITVMMFGRMAGEREIWRRYVRIGGERRVGSPRYVRLGEEGQSEEALRLQAKMMREGRSENTA